MICRAMERDVMSTNNLTQREHAQKKKNRRSPKIEPCGAPDIIAADAEKNIPVNDWQLWYGLIIT